MSLSIFNKRHKNHQLLGQSLSAVNNGNSHFVHQVIDLILEHFENIGGDKNVRFVQILNNEPGAQEEFLIQM